MGQIIDWVLTRFSGIKTGRGAPGAVHIAEVEVDTWLGHVRVLRMFAGLSVGKPQAPMLARSQAEGSIIQGIGYALYEGRQVDAATGAVLTAGLEDYRIPGIADTPEMHIHFEEGGFDHVPGGGHRHRRDLRRCPWLRPSPTPSTTPPGAGRTSCRSGRTGCWRFSAQEDA